MEWFLQNEVNEPVQQAALQRAYYNTLCHTDEGRQVLCHLEVITNAMIADPETPPLEKIAYVKIMRSIENNCGIANEKAVTDAKCKTAAGFTVNMPKTDDGIRI